MSEVNRDIYPLGQTGLNGMQICANKLNAYLNNEPWEQSIAISQSMNPNAPFNSVDFLTVDYNGLSVLHEHTQRNVQKIALTYIGTGASFGQNQYYNGSVDSIFIGATNELYYSYATLRKTGRTSFVQNCQAKYKPNLYDLITGIKYSNILCVLCVGFNNGLEYCSLKYYNEHKNTELANKTPACIFMLGFFGNADVSNVRRAIAPIDLTELHFQYWLLRSLNPIQIETTFADFYNAFPPCVGAGLNPLGVPNNHQLAVVLQAPSLIFPVVGCINGTLGKSQPWNTSPARNSNQGVVMYGGGYETMYTIDLDFADRIIRPILTQQAFDNALSIAATYGIPFTTDFPTDAHRLFNTDGLVTYAPIANAGGYFDGRFETLTESGEISQELSPENKTLWNGDENTPYNGRSYDPNIPIPTDNIDLTQPAMTAIDAFNRTYIIDGNSVDDLGALLWSGDQSFLDSVLKSFELYGEKPINGIINLMLFPFDVREKTGATRNETIKIGRYDTQIAAYRLPTNASAIYDFGSFKWVKEFDNFLDFEPFTTAELYVPFFGMFPLQNSHFIGKTIDIKVAVDFITGAATCIIYVSDRGIRHPVIYKNATLGIQIPVTGDDVSGRVNTILNNAMGVVPDVADMAKSAITKDIGGLAKSAISAEVHTFGADAVPTMYQTAGASTPECSLYLPKKPYIILYTPEIISSENYNNCVGYATFEDATIGDCHGFCKFDNIDLSNIIATDTEKTQILSALTGGVYL